MSYNFLSPVKGSLIFSPRIPRLIERVSRPNERVARGIIIRGGISDQPVPFKTLSVALTDSDEPFVETLTLV